MADDFVEYENDGMPGAPPTKEGVLGMFKMYVAAFPDLKPTPEEGARKR